MKKLKNISLIVLLLASMLALYMVYDYNPNRSILGYKTFYNGVEQEIVLASRSKVKVGNKVIILQLDQATIGLLNENNEVVTNNDIHVSIIDADIYKVIIEVRILYIVIIGLSFILILLYNKRKDKLNNKNISV